MNITCPRCTARYAVDPDGFGVGARLARCSNCGHLWRAEPDDADDLKLPPPADDIRPQRLADAIDAPDDRDRNDDAAWPDEDDVEPSTLPAPRRRVDRDEESLTTPAVPPAGGREPLAQEDDSDLDLALTADEDLAAVEEPAAEPEPPSALTPPPLASHADAAAAEKKRARKRLLIAVGAAVATLLICFGGLVGLQGPLTGAIPGMAALYHIVGLAPAPPGADLDIAEVTSSREWTDGEDLLIITGTVTNTAEEPRSIPPLRVTLFDAADREVQETIVEPEKTILAPREHVRFNARIANPASTARRMVVSFDTTAAGSS